MPIQNHQSDTFSYLRITNSFIDMTRKCNCEITWEKNNLPEDEIEVQICIPLWPTQIPCLAKFLFQVGLRHLYL